MARFPIVCVNNVLAEIINGSVVCDGTCPGGQLCGFLLTVLVRFMIDSHGAPR